LKETTRLKGVFYLHL